MNTLQLAEEYTNRDWRVIPIPARSKGPKLKNWCDLLLDVDELPKHFGNGQNIGLLLGEPSNWLVDVDVDRPEAALLATEILPETGAIFGRQSNPASHFLYYGEDIKTRKFKLPKGWDDEKDMVVEIRSTGCQTVAPGSVHPSGEPVRWDFKGEPESIEADELIRAVERLHKAALEIFVIRSAMLRISPNNYDDWFRVGVALYAWQEARKWQGNIGFRLWDEWSSNSGKYNADEMDGKWQSFANPPTSSRGPITLGSLFHLAKENGWEKLPKQDYYVNFVPLGVGEDAGSVGSGDPVSVANSPGLTDDEKEKITALVMNFGPPFYTRSTEAGKLRFDGINESFWAGLYADEHEILFEPVERAFYEYDGAIYRPITNDIIKSRVSASMLDHGRKVQSAGLQKSRTDKNLNAIVGHLRGIVEKRDAFKKGDEKFIHLQNGVIRFRDQVAELVNFSPEFRARNQSPIPYIAGADCPRFLNELLLPAVAEDDVSAVQKLFGVALLGENPIQRMWILDGTPGGGKSQVVSVLNSIVGDENCGELRTEQLAERFEMFRFLKKSLLVGVDVAADFLMTKGAYKLKGIVGGDRMDAEMKGGHGDFPIYGNFNVLITSNSRLRVKFMGDVGAWKRRIIIIRYEADPPKKKIPNFGRMLVQEEGPGILNWAFQGLAALLADIRETGDIRLSERQQGIVESLMAESDSLREYLKREVVSNDSMGLTVDEIIQGYAEYCPDRSWNPLPITVLHKQLPELMLEMFRTVKANSIQRDGKGHKGFRRVGFRRDLEVETSTESLMDAKSGEVEYAEFF